MRGLPAQCIAWAKGFKSLDCLDRCRYTRFRKALERHPVLRSSFIACSWAGRSPCRSRGDDKVCQGIVKVLSRYCMISSCILSCVLSCIVKVLSGYYQGTINVLSSGYCQGIKVNLFPAGASPVPRSRASDRRVRRKATSKGLENRRE